LLEEVKRHLDDLGDLERMVGTVPEDGASSAGPGNLAATPVKAEPQRPLIAGYEILGELGRGGMGVVYQARQIKLNRVVALKIILHVGHAVRTELARFRTEAEAIARLQHPNIVQIHEIGDCDGLPFFSLEYCPGGSLDRKLRGTPLPPSEAAALVETLALAMNAATRRAWSTAT
jgi:serine/threonine protein kinase